MNGNVPVISPSSGLVEIHQILALLRDVQQRLEEEMGAKQETIAAHEHQIRRLHQLIDQRDELLRESSERLAQVERGCEGQKQLINKLLSDIDGLYRDVEWYKRTYEKRGLAGIFFDRFKGFIRRKK